jgi:AbiV family abortive infection protein
MDRMTVNQLHALRLSIFDNAECLYKEADLLLQNGMVPRAYLLAHLCFEELGKIPIIVGAISTLLSGKKVDWKKFKRRFYSHRAKISSQNHHYYMFGLDLDLTKDSDLKWLESANEKVDLSYERKNLATYVDVNNGNVLEPAAQISRESCEELVKLAFECLRAHWTSERLTNPLIKDVAKGGADPANG